LGAGDSACEGIDTVEEFGREKRKGGSEGKKVGVKEREKGGNLDGEKKREQTASPEDLDIQRGFTLARYGDIKRLLTTRKA
jgi:uncharacterized membrane-anchored protein